jgi:hypothetical protein
MSRSDASAIQLLFKSANIRPMLLSGNAAKPRSLRLDSLGDHSY